MDDVTRRGKNVQPEKNTPIKITQHVMCEEKVSFYVGEERIMALVVKQSI